MLRNPPERLCCGRQKDKTLHSHWLLRKGITLHLLKKRPLFMCLMAKVASVFVA